jgi:hypothetical protein
MVCESGEYQGQVFRDDLTIFPGLFSPLLVEILNPQARS